jgi:2-iminobutanoate/2-iminopropanoate deaminase
MMKGSLFILMAGLITFSACSKSDNQRIVIATEHAPEAVGPYSQGIMVGNTLYAAGQIGLDPTTGNMISEGLEDQAIQVLENLKAVILEAGMDMADVVDVDVYLTDMDDYPAFNRIYSNYFSENPPARAVVEVSALPLGALVEVKAIAVSTGRN